MLALQKRACKVKDTKSVARVKKYNDEKESKTITKNFMIWGQQHSKTIWIFYKFKNEILITDLNAKV